MVCLFPFVDSIPLSIFNLSTPTKNMNNNMLCYYRDGTSVVHCALARQTCAQAVGEGVLFE